MSKPLIILLSGKARSGKDSSYNYLKKLFERDGKKVAHTCFAKYLKQYAIDYFGWDGREETKPRELLQKLGTDVIRTKLKKPNFHVNRTCEDIEILSDYFDVFIITDARFPNEIEVTKVLFNDNVISIKCVRKNFKSPLTLEQQQHKSETALDGYKHFNYTIEAEGLGELYAQLDEIYQEIRGDGNE